MDMRQNTTAENSFKNLFFGLLPLYMQTYKGEFSDDKGIERTG